MSGVAARGELLNLQDAPSHPSWHVSRDFGERTGMRAYLGAAIRRAGESLGVLEVCANASCRSNPPTRTCCAPSLTWWPSRLATRGRPRACAPRSAA
ncbi:MAG: GAF domain-containing protein [Chloroflexi bacterium]|nr:GAF domain-containing protein [Chloroflexota bacterium]